MMHLPRRMFYRLDRDGNPIECETYEEWIEWEKTNQNLLRVGATFFPGGVVITSFMGRNLAMGEFKETGPPVVFETMVFGGPWSGLQKRSCTLESAKQAHQEVVDLLQIPLSGPMAKTIREIMEL